MRNASRETRPKHNTSLKTFLIFFAVFGVVTFWMIAPFMLPLLMGSILATLSYPLYARARRRGFGPKKTAVALTLAILLIVILPLGAFGTVAVKQAVSIGEYVSRQESLTLSSLTDRVARWAPVEAIIGDVERVRVQARQTLQQGAQFVTKALLGVLAGVPTLGFHLALALIACFFFLLDGDRFVRWVANRIPMDNDIKSSLLTAFRDTTVSTIWATLAAAGVQSLMMFGAFMVLGVPAAFLAAGATFIFAWIPVLGSLPVWTVGALYLYLQDSPGKAIAMIGIGIVTSLVDNFIRPMVLQGRSDMHPLVALVSIFGGIQAFGIFGVFYGPILSALLIAFLNAWPLVGQRFDLFVPLSEKGKAA